MIGTPNYFLNGKLIKSEIGLIRSATSGRRQLAGSSGDVSADDGKIAVFEFKNIRAALATGRLLAVGVRVRAESFCKHVNM